MGRSLWLACGRGTFFFVHCHVRFHVWPFIRPRDLLICIIFLFFVGNFNLIIVLVCIWDDEASAFAARKKNSASDLYGNRIAIPFSLVVVACRDTVENGEMGHGGHEVGWGELKLFYTVISIFFMAIVCVILTILCVCIFFFNS